MATNHYRCERRLLQLAVFLAACVPVVAGAFGMVMGTALWTHAGDAGLDNHFRYLSGLLCGLGINFWIMVPTIEKHTIRARVLTSLVMLGGIARLVSAIAVARPPLPMELAIVMELVVTPLLCVWQARIARMAR